MTAISRVAITGHLESGKSTAATALVGAGHAKMALADGVRELLAAIDPIVDPEGGTTWNEAMATYGYAEMKVRFPLSRQLMQRAGTEGGRELFGENIWVQRLLRKVDEHPDDAIVVDDVRFHNEADGLRAAGFTVVRIVRPGQDTSGPEFQHGSEVEVPHLDVDAEIINWGTVTDLHRTVLDPMAWDWGRRSAKSAA